MSMFYSQSLCMFRRYLWLRLTPLCHSIAHVHVLQPEFMCVQEIPVSQADTFVPLYSSCPCFIARVYVCVQEIPVRVRLIHAKHPSVLKAPPALLWLTLLCVPVRLTLLGLSVMWVDGTLLWLPFVCVYIWGKIQPYTMYVSDWVAEQRQSNDISCR